MTSALDQFEGAILQWLATLFIFVVGIVALVLVIIFIIDKTQRADAIRRNFPVIGRFRDLFLHLGKFFRQYFFAMDREEMPFNRAERNWAKRASENTDLTLGFGSTRNLTTSGSVIFMNGPFPTLDEDVVESPHLIIGPDCRVPYHAQSFFNISAMSYGSISKVAVQALSRGAAKAGCWLNTGEGGLAPYHLEGGADIVFQIGTAKYGVRDPGARLDDDKLREVAAHDEVKMFELKMSQGAKPGKGGILPGVKVTEEIAEIRGIPAGEDSISPNGHPEIRTPEDLLDMIARIRDVTGKPTGFKAVIGSHDYIDTLFQEVLRRGPESAPDFITVDSGDGGSGAAPQPLLDYVGLLLRESLPMIVDLRDRYGLKERVRIVASGKLITPSMVAWALAMGADFVNTARGFMFSLGCIQAMQCNRNTCPTGVTTHNKDLQKGLDVTDKSVRVAHYHKNIVNSVGMIAHSCGVAEPRKLRRCHVRVVTESGLSIPLSQLHPNHNIQSSGTPKQ